MPRNLDAYAFWTDADYPGFYYWFPYINTTMDEEEDLNFSSDNLSTESGTPSRSLGRVYYQGDFTFNLTPQMTNFLKKWIITDRYTASNQYRLLVHDNGNFHYTYTRVYPVRLSISSTPPGIVSATLSVIARGEDAASRSRLIAPHVPVGNWGAWPLEAAYYAPVSFHSTTMVSAGDYTWDAEECLSWSVNIETGFQGKATGTSFVPKYFDRGKLSASGSVTLYNETYGVRECDALEEFLVSLWAPQTVVGGEPVSSLWLSFFNCSPVDDTGTSGSRAELRTRILDWNAKAHRILPDDLGGNPVGAQHNLPVA